MRRSLALAGLAVLAVLAAGLPAPTYAQAIATAAECRGKPATIVDVDGGRVVGTKGDDVIVVDTPPGRSSPYVRGRAGNDTICLSGRTIDDGYGSIVDAGKGDDAVEVRTTDEQDRISIANAETVDIVLGAGGAKGDSIDFKGIVGAGTVTTQSGGLLTAYGMEDVVMEGGIVAVDAGSKGLAVSGFSSVRGFAPRVRLEGQDGADRLLGKACHLMLSGGRGPDRLVANPRRSFVPFSCAGRTTTLLGLRGDDRLIGGRYTDVLIGGPGRDSANGGRGQDRCLAEFERKCER